MTYMTKHLSLTILICLAFSVGCVSPGGKEERTSRLERLRGGMRMREAVELLGPATAVTAIRESPRSNKYYSLTYTNSLINPGVVELIFDPDLIEIRLNGKLYRDLIRPE